jgi:hypothetical protein
VSERLSSPLPEFGRHSFIQARIGLGNFCESPCYFPREVFFFGLGFVVVPVPFAMAAVCRFCFFVAI